MRKVCLGAPPSKTSGLPTLAPPLLRQFASVGNNLNQIARKINSGQWSGHDRVHVVAALMAIGRELSELRMRSVNRENGMIVKFHAREKAVAVVRLITCWAGNVAGKGREFCGVLPKRCGNSSMPRRLRKNTPRGFCLLQSRPCHRESVKG